MEQKTALESQLSFANAKLAAEKNMVHQIVEDERVCDDGDGDGEVSDFFCSEIIRPTNSSGNSKKRRL